MRLWPKTRFGQGLVLASYLGLATAQGFFIDKIIDATHEMFFSPQTHSQIEPRISQEVLEERVSQLEWKYFPMTDEEIRLAQNDPSVFHRADDRLSEESVEYLIDLAENELGYGSLERLSADELIIVTAHLVEYITEPNWIAYLTNDPYNNNPNARINMTALGRLVEIDPSILKQSGNLRELSKKEREKMYKTTTEKVVTKYRNNEEPQLANCDLTTFLTRNIFDELKKRYETFENIDYIPMIIKEQNHLRQGFYNKIKNEIIVLDLSL